MMTTFPFFMSLFDIPVRLSHLFQWINPINDRFYLSRLDQPCEEDKVFDFFACWPQTRRCELGFLATCYGRPQHLKHGPRHDARG